MKDPIIVREDDLPSLKNRIGKALPGMKHARAIEILAAALGHKSYAALRAAVSNGGEAICDPLLHADGVAAKLERFKDGDPSASAESVRRLMADLAHWERMARIGGESALAMAHGRTHRPEDFPAVQLMARRIREDGWEPNAFAEHIRESTRRFGRDPEAGFRELEQMIERDRKRFEREERLARDARIA